jgi:DNA-binding beta-propeller fold protein YncE
MNVTEYSKGSIHPDVTISFAKLEGHAPYAVALDNRDDLFVTALGYPKAQAYEVPNGSQTPKDLGINKITVMHGIAVDARGDVAIADQATVIYVYPPGSHTPEEKIYKHLIEPDFIALDRDQSNLYVTGGFNGWDGGIWVYSYPSGKPDVEIHLPGLEPTGIAVSSI